MDDVEMTQQESKANIERVEAALGQAQDLLDRSKDAVGPEASSPGFVRSFVARQPKDAQEEFEREVKAVNEEIERDLPRQEAKRSVRVKPTRQMV